MRGAVVGPAFATLLSTVSALPPARPEAGIFPEPFVPQEEVSSIKPLPGRDWCGNLLPTRYSSIHDNQKLLASPNLNSNDLEKRDVQSRAVLGSGYDEYPKDDSYSFNLRVFVKVDPTKCRAAVNSDDRKVSRVDLSACSRDGLTLKFELEKDDFGPFKFDQDDNSRDGNNDQYPWDGQDDFPVDRNEDRGRGGSSNNDRGRNGYDNNAFDRNGFGNNKDFGRNGFGNNDFDRDGFGRNVFDRYKEQCIPRCQCSPDDDNCQLCKSRCQCSPDSNDQREQTPRCQCSPEDDQCKKCNSICQCSPIRLWKQMDKESHEAIEFEDYDDTDEALDTLLTRDTSTEAGGGRGYSRSSRYGDSNNGGSSFDYGYGDDRNGGSGSGYEKHESSSFEWPGYSGSDSPSQGNRGSGFDSSSQGNRGSGDDYGCNFGDCPPQKNKDRLIFVLQGFRPLY